MDTPQIAQLRTITRLQMTKRGRMAVFFDDVFDFSVDEETFVKENLRVGRKFTEEEYEELKRETQYMKAKEKAFSLLSYKSWTRKLLCERLGQDFSEDCVEEVLDRIEELGLINDADYAVRCARDLVNIKHYALSRVKLELARRGISQNDIEDALEEFDNFDEAEAVKQLLEKKYRSTIADEKVRRRATAAMLRLGYELDDIRRGINALCEDIVQEEDDKEETEERDVVAEITALLQKKYKNALGDQKGIERAIRGMMRRGYHYGDIKSALTGLLEE